MSDLFKPLNEGYEFNGNEFFSEGWNMFKKDFWSFVGVTFLYLIGLAVLDYIPYLKHFDTYFQYLFFGGYFLFCRNMILGKQKMSDFFGGFNYFGQIALHLIVYGLMLIPIFIILFSFFIPLNDIFGMVDSGYNSEIFSSGLDGNPIFFVFFVFVFFFYFLYLSISYTFVLPLIVDSKLGFWQAMELSRKVVAKHFFSYLGFFILLSIAAFIFIIVTLLTGTLVVIPVFYCIIFVMYNSIFKIGEGVELDEIESFGQSVTDINTESQERNIEH